MKKLFCATAVLLFLAGCSTTSGSDPVVSHSGFDNAKVVTIDIHGNGCSGRVCTGLGAQWSGKTPDETILIVNVYGISAITGAKFNIDGTVYDLKIKETFTNFTRFVSKFGSMPTESSKGFLVPTDLVRKITASQHTYLRVNTTSGYIEDTVINGQTDSKAFNALKRFLAEVDRRS